MKAVGEKRRKNKEREQKPKKSKLTQLWQSSDAEPWVGALWDAVGWTRP